MCGTSLDGVDGALIRIREGTVSLAAFEHHPFPAGVTRWIRGYLGGNESGLSTLEWWGDLENLMASAELSLMEKLLSISGVSPEEIHGAGTHGLTAFHRPSPHPPPWPGPNTGWEDLPGASVQISNPYRLAHHFHIPVVFDFRRADVSRKGSGAPLAPIFHRAVFSDQKDPRAFLNLGGIANLTYLPALSDPDSKMQAFDTGPGNMLMDLYVSRVTHGQETFDRDGQRSSRGQVLQPALSFILDDPWFAIPPPKSTGREEWGEKRLSSLLERVSLHEAVKETDLLATFSEATACAIRRGLEWISPKPKLLIIGGGGTRNPDLMNRISRVTGIPVRPSESFGWPSQAIESMAFAYLAALTLSGRPGSFPGTTGADTPVLTGAVVPPPHGLLPARLQEIREAADIHLPSPDRANPL
ncbi:MAG: anhydro-N-acetylmuramic acid kinase [Leptospirales bacterium]